jgi:hypothetical protein
MILNQHLYRLLRHSRLSAFQSFVQQSLDGFFVKARPVLCCFASHACWAPRCPAAHAQLQRRCPPP